MNTDFKDLPRSLCTWCSIEERIFLALYSAYVNLFGSAVEDEAVLKTEHKWESDKVILSVGTITFK